MKLDFLGGRGSCAPSQTRNIYPSFLISKTACVPTTWTRWCLGHHRSRKKQVSPDGLREEKVAAAEVSRIARESTEEEVVGEGGRGGGGGRRDEMVREDSGDRNGDSGVRADQGEAKGRGGEENTVNNGTSAKMPGKLEGRESGGVRGEEEECGGTSCEKKVGSEAQTNSIFVVVVVV